MKKIEVPSLIIKDKFKYHKQYKEKTLDLINSTKDGDWKNNINNAYDNISKLDWNLSKNFERPWVKLIGNFIHEQLNNFAIEMGYQKIKLTELWYQQYQKEAIHNWHIHSGNYTGVYYLEFDKNSPTTEFLYPNNLNNCFTIDVEEGDIIIFPSYFIHRSQKNFIDKIKTIISFNLEFENLQNEFTKDKEISVRFY